MARLWFNKIELIEDVGRKEIEELLKDDGVYVIFNVIWAVDNFLEKHWKPTIENPNRPKLDPTDNLRIRKFGVLMNKTPIDVILMRLANRDIQLVRLSW